MKTPLEISLPLEIDLVSFNVPCPPDYGGVIDVFYKIKALTELGVRVHLHSFVYGRRRSLELEKICETVSYYQRSRSLATLFSAYPHIVASRNSQKLFTRLSTTNRPVLLEGIHCTLPLLLLDLNGRRVVIRSHNIEHEYYYGLAKSTSCFLKRLFYNQEARKLQKFEAIVEKSSAVACISESDRMHFGKKYSVFSETITPFHSFDGVKSQEGFGNYVLIHGDLSVPENQKSISWLIDEVVFKIPFPVVIAGKNPPKHFSLKVAKNKNINLVPNPTNPELKNLIANAHVNLIHSFYPQGFKLKLLHSLYGGRFCICNSEVVVDTGLDKACFIANSSQDFIKSIHIAFETHFSSEMIQERQNLLNPFSNGVQARKLVQLLVG